MGSLEGRLRRLEGAASGLYSMLYLPDGTRVLHEEVEMLAAVGAAAHGDKHWLLPHIRQVPTNHGLPGLVRSLEDSRAREAAKDEG